MTECADEGVVTDVMCPRLVRSVREEDWVYDAGPGYSQVTPLVIFAGAKVGSNPRQQQSYNAQAGGAVTAQVASQLRM